MFVVCFALLALLAAGCTKLPMIATEGAGHVITAEIEGTPSIETHSELAVISGPHGRVMIERERMRLDDLEWTTIPANVPVQISLKRNKAKIIAGNVTIGRTIRN